MHHFPGTCCSKWSEVATEIIISEGGYKIEKIPWVFFIAGNVGFVSPLLSASSGSSQPLLLLQEEHLPYPSLFRAQLDMLG